MTVCDNPTLSMVMATPQLQESQSSDGEYSGETARRPKRRRSLIVCGHCDRALTKSTYYRHKRRYFSHVSGTRFRGDVVQRQESVSRHCQCDSTPTPVGGATETHPSG